MAPYEHSEALARDWGATLVDAGPAGHINGESGHGPWPEGLMRFGGLLAKI
jgi:predicted alpha/beta hydrolase family esterase